MALEDDIRTLGRTPLLDELGRDALRLIAFSADRLTLASGATLFHEGDRADSGFVVTAGAIRLSRGEDGANGVRVVQIGTLIGELACSATRRGPRPPPPKARRRSTGSRAACSRACSTSIRICPASFTPGSAIG